MLIYLIRHATVDRTSPTSYHTLPGPSLTAEGIKQSEATARLLDRSGIERVVSSPMRRCVMTAEPICRIVGVPLQTDADLGEVQHGEPDAEVAVRMLRASLTQLDASTVALVSHAAPLEQLMLALTRNQLVLPMSDRHGARVAAGGVWQLVRRDGDWRARYLPPGGIVA